MDVTDFEIGPLKPSLQIQIRNQQQFAIAVLKDQHSGKVFQCTTAVLELLQQIPSSMSARHFVQSYPQQQQEMLLTILRQAQAHSLLQQPSALGTEPNPAGWYQRDWLMIKLAQFEPNRLLALVWPLYQLLFSKRVRWIWLFGYLLAAWQLWQHSPHFWSQFYLFSQFQNWLWLYACLLLSTCCHELGHAYCCQRYGGKVGALGLALYFGQLVAYVDVSDAWLLPAKWHRIKVALAGVYVEAILALFALWLWVLLPVASLGAQLAFLFFIVTSSRICLNMLPLLRLDGYWVLSDWLEAPNLRTHAAAFSLSLLPGIRQRFRLSLTLNRRLQLFYLVFSLASALMVGLALRVSYLGLTSWLAELHWLANGLALLLSLLFLLSLGHFYRRIFQRYFTKRNPIVSEE